MTDAERLRVLNEQVGALRFCVSSAAGMLEKMTAWLARYPALAEAEAVDNRIREMRSEVAWLRAEAAKTVPASVDCASTSPGERDSVEGAR